jgi:hypothetical protein
VVNQHKGQFHIETKSEPAWTPPPFTEAEQAFLESWCEELLHRAWGGLADIERKTGQPCWSVLRLRTDHPFWSSAELAEQLGARLGKPYSVHAVRQVLHRAREKFTDLLLSEVVQSMEDHSPELLEQELLDLGLLDYCRSALRRGQREQEESGSG